MTLPENFDLFQTLEMIRKQPSLYIGEPHLSNLFMFIVGYQTTMEQYGIKLNGAEINFYNHFHNFVKTKYNLQNADSWGKIILLHSGDERRGFDSFFQILKEFKEDQSKSIINLRIG
jgi:hypothetical protein